VGPPAPTERGPFAIQWREWLTSPRRERTSAIVLAVAIAISIAVVLNETHGATFSLDEFLYFVDDRGFDFKTLMSPHNGNFIAVTRFLYAIAFKVAGPNYVVFRVWLAIEVAATALLFYLLARRRIAPIAALALTLPLLFLGSSMDVAISTIGIQHLLSIILCLSALLALERGSRGGEVLACLLLTLAVATFSIAFAFIAGVAVSVLLRGDRLRRTWIFAVPIAVYLLWLVAAPKYSGPGYLGTTHVRASNIFLIPSFLADSAGAVIAGVSGLSYDFTLSHPSTTLTNYSWALPLALAAVAGLFWRVRRSQVEPWFWAYLAIPLVFWLSIVIAIQPNRYPNSDRYIYGGAVAVLLLAAEALRRVRLSPAVLVGLLAAGAGATLGNIAQMRVDGSVVRAQGSEVRAALAGIDLARDRVAPGFVPPAGYPALMILWAGGVDRYLQAVRRHGPFAFTVAELRQQRISVRRLADSTLVAALGIRLQAVARINPTASCRQLPAGGRPITRSKLSPPGATLSAATDGPVRLGRFAPPSAIGTLQRRRLYELAIPRDRSSVPWTVSIPAGVRTLCTGEPRRAFGDRRASGLRERQTAGKPCRSAPAAAPRRLLTERRGERIEPAPRGAAPPCPF